VSTPAAAPEAREPTCECGHDHQRGGTTACFADGCRCLDFRAPARPAPQGAPGFDMDRVMNEFVNAIHDGDDDRAQRAQNTLYDQFATLRAQAVAGAEDTARLVKENTRLREPDTYWLADDPETGNNDVEDFRDVIEVGEVARLIVGHTLPPQWAAHVRIPETPTSDADSEVQLFATAAEAHAALATPERAP
jgi:hypothetical protein